MHLWDYLLLFITCFNNEKDEQSEKGAALFPSDQNTRRSDAAVLCVKKYIAVCSIPKTKRTKSAKFQILFFKHLTT